MKLIKQKRGLYTEFLTSSTLTLIITLFLSLVGTTSPGTNQILTPLAKPIILYSPPIQEYLVPQGTDQTEPQQQGILGEAGLRDPEKCNGLDDNGDGNIDEGCDDDNDGYCDETVEFIEPYECSGSDNCCPLGEGDFNDNLASAYPGAFDICDGNDNDNDGLYDETCQCSEFDHSMRFFQVRNSAAGSTTPLPEDLVEFTIGAGYEDLWKYLYMAITTDLGNIEIDMVAAQVYKLDLTEEEILTIFGEHDTVPISWIRKKDIEKIHQELITTHPELFPHGNELYFGAELDEEGYVVFGGNGQPIQPRELELEDYWHGKTIVYPINYFHPGKLYFNVNSPAVREYMIRYALLRQDNTFYKSIFQDNFLTNDGQYSVGGVTQHYVSGGTKQEQMQIVADHYTNILNQIKTREDPSGGSNQGLILNNFRDNVEGGLVFLNTITQVENANGFDTMMCENYFYLDDYADNITFYLDWIETLDNLDKELAFVVSVDERLHTNSEFVSDIWLWLHLVSSSNTLTFINKNHEEMIDYLVYDYPLGEPLNDPIKEGDIWKRTYERGEIIFNSSLERIDTIYFNETTCCYAESCNDGIDNDCDGLVDASDSDCQDDGNGEDPNGNNNNNGNGGSNYDDPQCEDGIDNDNDTLIDYPEDPDCSSPNDDSEAPEDPLNQRRDECEELWDCGQWDECINGKETRECFDLHECGTEEKKPSLERSCFSLNINDKKLDLDYTSIFAYSTLSLVGLAGIITAIVLRLKHIRKLKTR